MALSAAFAMASILQNEVDPLKLDIGPKGTVTANLGLTGLRSGKPATVADVVTTAKGKRFVYLGENHATAAHQNLHADVIRALADSGRQVVIGMEMITRPKQDALDDWVAGKLDEESFKTNVDWKNQWGFDYSFYKPIFDVAKERHLPVVALNVPREWVRAVGRGGYAALSTAARLQLPAELFLGNKDHREVFEALMGGHPMSGAMGDNIYAAQVLWDEGMADTALKYLERYPAPNQVMVILAGSGHVMYRQAINYRIARRHGGDGITVVMTQSDTPVEVSKGLGDFVYVTKP